jgi:hypothetical protein
MGDHDLVLAGDIHSPIMRPVLLFLISMQRMLHLRLLLGYFGHALPLLD